MNKSKLLYRDAFYCLVLALLFIGCLYYLVINISLFNPFTAAFKDFSFLDIYYSEKMHNPKPDNTIILINIEHRDRYEIAQILQKVQKENPKVVGVDVIFKEEKNKFSDSLLKIQLQKTNTILTKAFISKKLVSNSPYFSKETNKVGYSNINFNNTSGVIRTFQGYRTIKNTNHIAFPLLIAQEYLQKDNTHFKAVSTKPITIKYNGSLENYLNFGYDEFMQTADVSFLKGKIVLVGYLGTPHNSPYDIEDSFFTPLNTTLAGKSTPDMKGVVVHANIIDMFLKNRFLYQTTSIQNILIASLLGYIMIVLLIILSTKNPASFMLSKKITHLFLAILFLWSALALYKNNILLEPSKIIAIIIISVEFIGVYKILCKKLHTKYQWKSYFYS
jgi:CHASE2 domain-containing sensor protein